VNKWLKVTILSISLLTVMSGAAVAPALAEIARAFPHIGSNSIKMVLTVPCLLIILGSLISGRLVSVMKKRSILLIGLSLYLVGGLGAGMVDSFTALLVLRGILGLGVGLIMPLSISLIADYYSGDERGRLMGMSTAVSSLGGIIATVLSGIVAVISWRWSFSIYALGFAVLFLVLCFLPKLEKESAADSEFKAQPLPSSIYYTAILTFGLLIVFFAIVTSLALFIQNQGWGNANTTGLALGLTNIFVFGAGVKFQTVYSRFKSYTVPGGLLLLVVGFTLLSLSHNIYTVLAGLAVFGLGFGILMPLIYLQTTSVVSEEMRPRATALVGGCFYLGQFASPLVLSLVGIISGNYSIRMIFTVLTFALLAAFIVSAVMTIKKSHTLYHESNETM